MTPKLQALKDALAAFDGLAVCSFGRGDARKRLNEAATAAGFQPSRAVEDWARYQVAVAESAERLSEAAEQDPEQAGLFQ